MVDSGKGMGNTEQVAVNALMCWSVLVGKRYLGWVCVMYYYRVTHLTSIFSAQHYDVLALVLYFARIFSHASVDLSLFPDENSTVST